MALTRTTKLEAVNTMLATIGESPVNSLTGQLGVDVRLAQSTLDEVLKAVQSRGYHFNVEHDVDLAKDVNGYIYVANNVVEVDVDPASYPNIDPVLIGNRLYDRKEHTYVFSSDLKASLTYLREFDDVPEAVKRYVTIRAGRVFQARYPGDRVADAYSERDEMEAKGAFDQFVSDTGDLNIFDSYLPAATITR